MTPTAGGAMTVIDERQAVDVDATIAEMVARLARKFDPYRIILFGSRARGDAQECSDVDLLVVMPNGTDRSAAAIEMRAPLRGMPLTKDIVVTTPDAIERDGHFVTSVLRPAIREGVVLHERQPPSPVLARALATCTKRMSSMRANTPDAVAKALDWLRQAQDEVRTARASLALDPPVTSTPCYLFQQVAEKTLKAAFQLDSVEFDFTHELHELWDDRPPGWPEARNRDDLKWLSQWNTRGRYPADLPQATLEDAERAERIAQAVYDDVTAVFQRRGMDVESLLTDLPSLPRPPEPPPEPQLPGLDV